MTPDQRNREARRMAVAKKVVYALRLGQRPMRAMDLAESIGISAHSVAASLKELLKIGAVDRSIPITRSDPIVWTLKPSTDVPPEYIQASSIWQVGYRVARNMGALA